MTTYKDLKSVKYIESIINYAEGLLNFNFKRTGNNRYSAYCPFHFDRKDSFRVYVDGEDEVKFHCFGECNMNWDIYDVIMVRNKCSFRQAQQTLADFLGIKDFKPYGGKSTSIPDFDQLKEPDEPIDFAKPEKLAPEIIDTLRDASVFYNKILINNKSAHKFIRFLPSIRETYNLRGVPVVTLIAVADQQSTQVNAEHVRLAATEIF